MVLENVNLQLQQYLLSLYEKDISLKKYLIKDKEIQCKIFILESLYQIHDWLVYSDFAAYTELVKSICEDAIEDNNPLEVEVPVSPYHFFEEVWAGANYCCEQYEEEWEGTQPICELT